MAKAKLATEEQQKKATTTTKTNNTYSVGGSSTGKPSSSVELIKNPTYSKSSDNAYATAKNNYNTLVQNGVQYSNNTMLAQNYLTEARNNLNNNIYKEQRDALVDKIMNREDFSYDASKDTLWQNALASAMESGKTAMADTMGQASALTGGYGSSYATAAAAGTYNQYIKDIYDNLPQYYQMAMNQYEMEGNELYNQYNMINGQYQQEYNERQNAYNNAMTEYFNFANQDINLYNTDVANAFNALGIASDEYDKSYDALAQSIRDQNNNTLTGWNMDWSNYWNTQDAAMKQKQLDQDAAQFDANMRYRAERDAIEDQRYNAQVEREAYYKSPEYLTEAYYASHPDALTSTDPQLKPVTDTMMQTGIKRAVKGGMNGLLTYLDSISEYDGAVIEDYVANTLTFTKKTGSDGEDVFIDGNGQEWSTKELQKEWKLSDNQISTISKAASETTGYDILNKKSVVGIKEKKKPSQYASGSGSTKTNSKY